MNQYFTYLDVDVEGHSSKLKTAFMCDVTINKDTNEAMIYIPSLDQEISRVMKSDKLSDVGVYRYPKDNSSKSLDEKIIDKHGDKRMAKIVSLDGKGNRVKVRLIKESKNIWVPFKVIHGYSYSCPNLYFPENAVAKTNIIRHAKNNGYLAVTSNVNYALLLDSCLKDILLKNLSESLNVYSKMSVNYVDDDSDDCLEGPDDDYPEDGPDDHEVHKPGEDFTDLKWNRITDE